MQFDIISVTKIKYMNTFISTSEYMFRASLDFNKKLSECTDQELEQIKNTVLSRRAKSSGLRKI